MRGQLTGELLVWASGGQVLANGAQPEEIIWNNYPVGPPAAGNEIGVGCKELLLERAMEDHKLPACLHEHFSLACTAGLLSNISHLKILLPSPPNWHLSPSWREINLWERKALPLQDKLSSCILLYLQVDHILPIREETACKVGKTHIQLTDSPGFPWGCVLSPLLVSLDSAALPATSLPSYWSVWGVKGEVLVTFWPYRLTAVGLSYMGAISPTFLTFWCINHDCEVKFVCLWQFVLKVFEQFSTPLLCSSMWL